MPLGSRVARCLYALGDRSRLAKGLVRAEPPAILTVGFEDANPDCDGFVIMRELDYLAEPVTDLPRRSGLGLNRKVIDRDVVKFLAELPTWPVPRPLGLPPSRMSGRGEPGGAERVPLIQGVRIRDTQGHARSRAPGLDYLVDQVTYHRGCFPPEAAGMCVALPRRMAATRRRVGLSSKR